MHICNSFVSCAETDFRVVVFYTPKQIFRVVNLLFKCLIALEIRPKLTLFAHTNALYKHKCRSGVLNDVCTKSI